MSMNPGVTTWPEASSSRWPDRPGPISAIRSPSIARSAGRPGAPVPSMTVPPRITRSCAIPRTSSSRRPGRLVGWSRRALTRGGPVDPITMPRRGLAARRQPLGPGLGSNMTAIPEAMRAAVYRQQGELNVEERPVPAVGPHDVLLEVSHCGICGSDIHFVLEGWGQPGSVEGHEWAGRVVAVGDAVTRWSVGDEVVGGPSPRCGECEYCRAGRPSLCTARNTPGISAHADGAFAEYTLSDERGLRRVPDGVSLRAAALAEPLAVALHGL